MLLPFGCCLQAEIVHRVLDESGFSAVTVQPIVHAVEHALQILAVEFVHVLGKRRQAAVNGVIHFRVRFVLDLRECGSPRIGRVDRVLPACLRVNGRLVEDQGDVAEIAVLHVRARDRDAGHGRAAQREELLQLLFRQVVDGKQRAFFLHRIFRGKLDNVRCFCYTIPRRNIRAVHLRHFSPLRKKLLDVFSISSVQYISTTKQISNVGIIISIENAIDVVVYADVAGYINSYRNNDRNSCFRLPICPHNNTVVVHLLMLRGIPCNCHRVGKLYRQLFNDSPA